MNFGCEIRECERAFVRRREGRKGDDNVPNVLIFTFSESTLCCTILCCSFCSKESGDKQREGVSGSGSRSRA